MLNRSLFIRILMETAYLSPVFQVLKDLTLSKIIPKASTITANSILIQSKGDVTGGISNVGRW